MFWKHQVINRDMLCLPYLLYRWTPPGSSCSSTFSQDTDRHRSLFRKERDLGFCRLFSRQVHLASGAQGSSTTGSLDEEKSTKVCRDRGEVISCALHSIPKQNLVTQPAVEERKTCFRRCVSSRFVGEFWFWDPACGNRRACEIRSLLQRSLLSNFLLALWLRESVALLSPSSDSGQEQTADECFLLAWVLLWCRCKDP